MATASSIQAKLAAIGFKHEALKYPNPVKEPDVRAAMSGIRRTIGTKPSRKAPIILDDLRSQQARPAVAATRVRAVAERAADAVEAFAALD